MMSEGDTMEHAYGLDIPRTLEEACDPKRMALVVYDMQVGIVSQLPNGPKIVARVAEVEPAFPRDSAQVRIVPELSPLPSEAIIDKITMSAFSGTFLNLALRDCGIDAFAICGIATEVGIEPTVRHGTDLGYIPVIVQDACGAGHEAAGRRSLESLKFAGDSLITDASTINALFRKAGK